MQEASGLIQDSSGHGNHATSSAGTAGYSQTGPITNDPSDTAINFDNDPTYFSVPDHATLDLGDVFTIEAWVKRNNTGATGEICSKNTGAYSMAFTADDLVGIHVAGSQPVIKSVTTITDTDR